MTLAIIPGEWVEEAVCASVDPDAYFPEGQGAKNSAAKRICKTCPVRLECLEYAFEHDELWGLWGGLTAYERKNANADQRAAILAELRRVA